MTTVFIDGQAGTTGLQITERLRARRDIALRFLNDQERKDPARRQACLQESDISILCLPDDAARQAVDLAQGEGRLLDASTAFRTDADWAYGLPELCAEQRQHIACADRVSNPGCYPQGFILLIRPLIQAGILQRDHRLTCHAVSGYSGGGRQMIEARRQFDEVRRENDNTQAYGLTLTHKHVPEMQHYAGCNRRPLFTPSVAHYYQGMLVQIPLFLDTLQDTNVDKLHQLYSDLYGNESFIEVCPPGLSATDDVYLNPTAMNNTNRVQLMLFSSDEHLLLVARYDNLGKGAAGAAVQNLNLMLGMDEATSL